MGQVFKIFVQVEYENNLHTYQFNDLKHYLLERNKERYGYDYSMQKVKTFEVNGIPYEDKHFCGRLCDIDTYARHNCNQKVYKDEPTPQDILEQYLLSEIEGKKKKVLKYISDNKSINSLYVNGGGGYFGLVPGEICGYDFFGKDVHIEYVDDNSDVHRTKVGRSKILTTIKMLIARGTYLKDSNVKQHVEIDNKQLDGQMNIFDFIEK